MYFFDRVVRTDADGRYEMSYKERSELYGLIFFARDYLGVLHYVAEMRGDEEGGAAIPVKRLFPAAKVVVRPVIEEGRASIMPEWTVENVHEHTWVKDLLGCDNGRETRFTYRDWLSGKQSCSFHVPAGVWVSVGLRTPYEEQWCPITLAKRLRLGQRGVRDFGEVKFERALRIVVKVLNSKGEPLEGVPVRRLKDGRVWTVAHNSDAEGVTWFDMQPGTKGQFGVYCVDAGVSMQETMDYEVGPDDEGRQFEMTISDEMVGLLFGRAGDIE